MMKTKKIGFVDLYLSEWHANNYPAWIEVAAKKLGLSYELAYAYGEQEISPFDGRSGADWCHTFGAEKCKSIDELCEKSDVIIVLAPSNPEVHLRYAEAVLKHKKPTYIDKTFAPDYKTAREICGREASLAPLANPETGVGANPVHGMTYMVVGGGDIGFKGKQWAVADKKLLSEVFKLVYITEPSVLVSPRENPLVTDYIAYVDFAFGFGDARPIIFSDPSQA